MASGTFIRLLVGILIIILPFIVVYFTRDSFYLGLLVLYILIPVLFIMENSCNCEGCILSNYCEDETKFKFVKKAFSFIGFDEQKLNNIKYSYNCGNTYSDMYNYIKEKYYDK